MTIHHQTGESFSATAAASAPVVITYVLSSTVSIVTTVTGDARQYASVGILNGSLMLWSATMTQLEPTATIPYDIIAGTLIIKKGGTFTLQIPTTLQPGSMTANLTVATLNNPQGTPFTGVVAMWALTS